MRRSKAEKNTKWTWLTTSLILHLPVMTGHFNTSTYDWCPASKYIPALSSTKSTKNMLKGHLQREFKPVLQCAHTRPNLLWIKPQARASLGPGYVSFLRGGIASDVAHQLLDVTHSLLNDCVGRFQDWSNWKINSCNFRIPVFNRTVHALKCYMYHIHHVLKEWEILQHGAS